MGQCPKGSEKPLKNFGKGSDRSGCIAEVTLTTWQVGEVERGKSRFRKKSEEAVESSGEEWPRWRGVANSRDQKKWAD